MTLQNVIYRIIVILNVVPTTMNLWDLKVLLTTSWLIILMFWTLIVICQIIVLLLLIVHVTLQDPNVPKILIIIEIWTILQ